MSITIRKALPEDAYNYAMCHIACWQTAYKGIVFDEYLCEMIIKKEERIEKYKNVLQEPGDCEYYCVLHAETMIGFLTINKSQNDSKANVGEIWAIYLLEAYRGKGYGRDLLDFAVNELKQIDPVEILLWVFEKNIKARRFYEKCGFVFDGTKKESTAWGGPLVVVKYVLSVI